MTTTQVQSTGSQATRPGQAKGGHPGKVKAHTVQPTPTPADAHPIARTVGTSLGMLFVIAVPVLALLFWVGVFRFLFRPRRVVIVQKGR